MGDPVIGAQVARLYSPPTQTCIMETIEPKISIVGAGPGDPDLLTLKAIKTLRTADVVLYDALANREILNYTRKDAVLVYVGKRRGKCVYTQEEINQLIVQYALYYGHVVRLKGGDPFVFGRGSEEINHAKSYDIPTTVIPGITSAISVPEHLGIPVTARGVSESFWVLTGTTKNHQLSEDIAVAAKSTATLVILMGVHKLDQIVSILQKEGKGKTPTAIIQNGTTPEEKIVFGTVDSIQAAAEVEQISSPAIIIIGNVVKESGNFRHFYQTISKQHDPHIGLTKKQAN